MKKGVLKTLGLIMVMVMCLGMTVSAAPSPDANGFYDGVKVVDKNGNAAEVTVSKGDLSKYEKIISELKTREGLAAVMGDEYTDGMAVGTVLDISVPEGTEFPVTITFAFPRITADMKVQILHWTGSEWEKIATTVGDGYVEGVFNSLSPVAFVIEGDVSVFADGTSPKTSASSTPAMVTLLGLCAVLAAVGMKKKPIAR